MFKIETHLHTRPVSPCAHLEPEEMIRFYKEAGYKTVFISDHLAQGPYEKLEAFPTWQEKNGVLYDSFLRAKAQGERLGVNVLFSPELSLEGNHFLIYNADIEFFNNCDDLFNMTVKEFRKIAKENGITIIQAHPFRDGVCTPYPEFVDGFEAINSNPRHENYDEKVFALAKEYGLLISAGSDAHRTEDIGGAAVISPIEITTADEYLQLLKSGKAKLMKHGEII